MRAGPIPACLIAVLGATTVLLVGALAHPAAAQLAHHPFAIGANEGGVGHQSSFGAWILGWESYFYLKLTGAVRAAKSGDGPWLLVALSFAYGIFHAAGPGHGKAVITSYMVSNEVALRRGLAISLAAAVLQGLVATVLVGIAAYVFDATAPRMTQAAQTIELLSYLAIVALGLALVWRKGRALAALWRPAPASPPMALAATGPGFGGLALRAPIPASRFFADDGTAHVHGADCGCAGAHMPDPTLLGGKAFDWRAASVAVVTAGARPCSGAILVLVFALSQGIFVAGVAATFAMSLGTAITTGALAACAVFAKGLALRLSGGRRAVLVGKLVEFGAAAAVLLFGLALLGAAFSGVHASG